MLIVQISDPHVTAEGHLIGGLFDTRSYLARAVAHVMEMTPTPDVVLVSGDLAETGSRDEYEFVRDKLGKIKAPVYVVPGNHDDRNVLRAVLTDHAYLPRFGPLQYVVDDHSVRIIALDTAVPGASHGELSPETLDWLDIQMCADPRPTILLMHHSPARCGMPALDEIGLIAGRERLHDIVSRHEHVIRIMCGHLHRPITVGWAGTIVYFAPSVAHQIGLDLTPEAQLRLADDPPAVAVHVWAGDHALISHLDFIRTCTWSSDAMPSLIPASTFGA